MNCLSRLIALTIISSGDVESSYVKKRQRSLIVGGKTVDGDKYPYMAHVGNCGAVLVGANVFLTAAHCETPLRVVLNKEYSSSSNGRRKLLGGTSFHEKQAFQVISVLNHPNWGMGDSKSYDFRLLRVSGFPDAKHIVLDDGKYTNPNELLTIMGWGMTGVDKKLSEDLREADVNVIAYDTCNEKYDGTLDNKVMFCAGKSSGGTYIGTCEGDSGGPIVKPDVNGNDVLVGIVSFAAGECGNSNHPTVFAKVSAVYDWIDNTIKDWDCSEQLESRDRLLGSWSPPEVEESKFKSLFDEMSCAYIMDDETIKQAAKMYSSTPNLAF